MLAKLYIIVSNCQNLRWNMYFLQIHLSSLSSTFSLSVDNHGVSLSRSFRYGYDFTVSLLNPSIITIYFNWIILADSFFFSILQTKSRDRKGTPIYIQECQCHLHGYGSLHLSTLPALPWQKRLTLPTIKKSLQCSGHQTLKQSDELTETAISLLYNLSYPSYSFRRVNV